MPSTPCGTRGSTCRSPDGVDDLTPAALEAIAIDACRSAAAFIRGSTERDPSGTKSTTTDVVTATDLAAEELVRTELAARTPGARVLGEERGTGRLGTGPHDQVEWVVDPLDGTVNFTYGVPVSAVSVAAVVSGMPTAGAVLDIARDEVFSAHLGGGARLDGASVACNRPETIAMALVATGYSYAPELRHAHGLRIAELLRYVRDVRAFGSAALHLCWVACGRVDAYVERDIKPWDYAAGSIIATEAGATVELPCPENGDLILASHPDLHAELAALLS